MKTFEHFGFVSAADLKNFINERVLSLQNACLLLGSTATAYFLLKTTKIYLKRRKYREIPGPPANGYF